MNCKIFKSLNGLELIIKNRKSAIIFEIYPEEINKKYDFLFEFSTQRFYELLEYIEMISAKSWINLKPKEAESLGEDYYEYYDRELDNNGYITIRPNTLLIERPSLDSEKLYQFNKKKMESFIYDFRKMV